jgi:hypothetical protein
MTSDTPKPLTAIRQYYLELMNGSAHEVKLCPEKSSPLWPYRFGRNPTPDMLAEIDNIKVYPLEKNIAWAEFFESGGTRLGATERECLDCSGGSISDVKNCWNEACSLYPFRLGHNPNRAMSPEQREIAAARLKANVERGKAAKVAGGQNSPAHVGKNPEATRGSVQPDLGCRARKS